MRQLDHTSKVRVVAAKGKFLRPEIVGNAVAVSERLLREDVFTSVPVFQYTERARNWEELTRDVPNISPTAWENLDEQGIVPVGTFVQYGDILVGKIRSSEKDCELTVEEKMLRAIFGHIKNVVDASLRYEFRDTGIVCAVCVKEDEVSVDVMVRRELQVGDELSDKNGNILTIASILPEWDMPSFEGKRVDILVHPESSIVPHLHRQGFLKLKGKGRRKTSSDIVRLTKRTLQGEEKLVCSNWRTPYSLFTQQPLKDGFGNGVVTVSKEDAQAISAAGYPENVREMFSINSDASEARLRVYEEVVKNGTARSGSSEPEAVNIVEIMLKGMCLAPEWKNGNLTVRPATPEDVISWSSGEVANSDTIRHRTYRPIPNGLFCQRIFGPDRDWECACGKYRGVKFQGMICEQCGVLITDSKVRRRRFGHIELKHPVLHFWYREHVAEELSVPLSELDQMDRFKIEALLKEKGIDPAGIVLHTLPVIPPDLRPIIRMQDIGQFAQADSNDMYRRIINRNSRLTKLTELNAPPVIINNERGMLQVTVDQLFANRLMQLPLMWENGHPLVDIHCHLENAIDRLSTKRVTCTVQGSPVPDVRISSGTIGVPYEAVIRFLDPLVIRQLKLSGEADTIKSSRRIIEKRPDSPEVRAAVDNAANRPVLVLTGKRNVAVLRCVPVEGELLRIHPDDARTMNVAFDGEPLKLFATHTDKAQEELRSPSPMADTTSMVSDMDTKEIIRKAWSRSLVTLTDFDRLLLG